MTKIQTFLVNFIIFSEFFAAFVGLIYYNKVKNTHWKWLVYYLVFIFFAEFISLLILDDYPNFKKYYYNFFIIPVEFIFLFWLYSIKSLKNIRLFWISIFLYSICLLYYILNFENIAIISSINYIVGALLLMAMIILELINQIKSDKILFFKENMMFYINLGIILFYIGTLPFYAFNQVLYDNSVQIFNIYGIFTLTVCNLMYYLFAAAFIWGKPST